MKRKPRRGADPIEGQMELALNPGAFIPDRECFSFVSGLEEVAAEVGEPRRGVPEGLQLGREGRRLRRIPEAELTRPHARSRQCHGVNVVRPGG